MKLFGYEPNEFMALLKNNTDYRDGDYKKWLLETKQPPGMMEIYAQHLFGAVMGQTFPALFIFEWILNFYPIKYIVEIGTGSGGLSAYLQLQANIRNLGFVTYDALNRFQDKGNKMVANPPVNLAKYVNHRQLNVFEQPTIDEISAILKKNVSLVYCDNGNKPKEMKTFAPFILPGSIIGTHDWHDKFKIEDMVKKLNLDVIMEGLCIEGYTKMRFWHKRK